MQENLSSAYMAQVSFDISKEGNSLKGSAVVNSADSVRIDFLSPETLSGLCVQTTKGDDSSLISLSLSGISADLPKSALTPLSLCTTLFSKDISGDIKKISKDSFEPLNNNENIKIKYTKQNLTYEIIYKKHSGIPVSMTISDKDTVCKFEISKFKKI